jgi:subtilisin family serine protease
VPANQVNRLRALHNVASVVLQRTYRPLDDGGLSGSLPLVNVPAAWDNLGGAPQAGRGVLIAQIDTGIDIKHPCFSDASMPAPPFTPRADSLENAKLVNNKVIIARAYGANNGQQYSAADALGHGTFGAALEACNYNTATPIGTRFSGIAPRAWLANYNVFRGNQRFANPGRLERRCARRRGRDQHEPRVLARYR